MTKKTGFNVRLDVFLPIDKKDFGKQAATYAMMDAITKTKTLPNGFWDAAVIVDVAGKPGTADIPDAPKADEFDPASVPLTTDALPEGATVLESTTALDGSIFQTIRLADQTETFRRISDEQDRAETGDGGYRQVEGEVVTGGKTKTK